MILCSAQPSRYTSPVPPDHLPYGLPSLDHTPHYSTSPTSQVDAQSYKLLISPLSSPLPSQSSFIATNQPVVCNVYGSGQVAAIDICEPTFTTSHNCSAHADVSVLGTPSQYYQAACRLYESNMQPQDPLGRAAGTVCESEPRKPCHCSRSKCLQLYCECFANGVMCSNCDCSNCYNNAEHEVRRYEAIKLYLGRNPDAFRPKIAGGESGKVKGWHIKGCSCQRSRCLKNYCECFEANIKCTSSCKCVGCRNYDERSEMDPIEKTCKDKGPASVITTAMVEDVCNHLVAQAEKAEREGQSPIQAERMVLVEFGHCLTQIVKSMFKDK
uniref:spexin prohormone 2 isoform X3 n=1 Tax=Monopterus albus TaxID=43700 RepID=UPI0009B3C87C|nr:protein lin-54 homolog isoform X3 [Monopterus albus]